MKIKQVAGVCNQCAAMWPATYARMLVHSIVSISILNAYQLCRRQRQRVQSALRLRPHVLYNYRG